MAPWAATSSGSRTTSALAPPVGARSSPRTVLARVASRLVTSVTYLGCFSLVRLCLDRETSIEGPAGPGGRASTTARPPGSYGPPFVARLPRAAARRTPMAGSRGLADDRDIDPDLGPDAASAGA